MWCTYHNDEEVRLAVLDYNEDRGQMSTAKISVVASRILKAKAALLSTQVDENAFTLEGPSLVNLEIKAHRLMSPERSHDSHPDEPPWDLAVDEAQATQVSRYDSPSEVSFMCPPEV